MSGEELKMKLKEAGFSQAEVARLLGVSPQSFSQSLEAADIKTGFLEQICRAIGKNMTFFYGDIDLTVTADPNTMQEQIFKLRTENALLKEEVERLIKIKLPTKDSRIYNVWMKFMEITHEMQNLYKEEKGESI